jgi:hypothetical protein
MASSTEATTTVKHEGGFDANANINAQLNANANATTSHGKATILPARRARRNSPDVRGSGNVLNCR